MSGPIDLPALHRALDERLAAADAELAAGYPGDTRGGQPLHTVYVPADRYRATTAAEWGAAALALLARHGALFDELVGDADVVRRVRDRLRDRPIEDLRVDFEDGYRPGDPDTEDAEAVRVAAELAAELAARTQPAPWFGVRVKSLESATRARSLTTLATVVTGLATAGVPLARFVVTLPKVTSVEQVAAMAFACAGIESGLGLPAGALRFEVQVETPQSVLGADGTAPLARMIRSAEGRLSGLHFGTYDYTAALGIAAAQQRLDHPSAVHAKLVMQTAAAGTGVWLSDGSTNVVPAGTGEQVRAAWAEHLRLVRHALERGYHQGWDLHPGQLPTRYAATFAFYREGLDELTARLRAYVRREDSRVADEPATARALAGHLLRGLDAGAVTADEIAGRGGPDAATLRALADSHDAAGR